MGIGDTLADARRQAGLTITQVSQQTRIRESIIRSIEQGDFSPCGGDFYARGHVRSIAAVVGTDPVPLIREYDEEHGPPGAMRASQVFEPATPIKIREPRNLHLGRVLASLVVLALVGLGAYHFWPDNTHPAANTAADTTHRTTAPKTHATAKPTVTATPHVTTTPGPPEAIIKLTANEDCWIGFSTPSGQEIYQGIIPAGQTRTWDEKNPVSMVIGNPPGIVLTVNGKSENTNTVNVLTLNINPDSKDPVTAS